MDKRRTELFKLGGFLAMILNDPPKKAGSFAQIIEIIELLQSAPAAWAKDKGKGRPWHLPHLDPVLDRLEELLQWWRTIPDVFPDPNKKCSVSFHWVDAAPYERTPLVQWQAFNVIQSLVENDEIHRLLKCSYCHRWLFAARDGKKYCDEKCRQGKFDKTPKRMAYKRKKAREWYRDLFPADDPRKRRKGVR